MEKTTKMVEEITQKRKMPKDVRGKLNRRIFQNCLMAIGIMLYIGMINIIYLYANQNVVQLAMKILAMISVLVTVGIFEVAYRKDSGKIAIVGIEFLVVSIIVLYIPKIYSHLEKTFYSKLVFVPIFCAIYYVGKSILIYLKTEKEYQNHLSDVKEIVKEE